MWNQVAAAAALFLYGFASKMMRLAHDIYAVAVVVMLEQRRVIIVAFVVAGFAVVVLVQQLSKTRVRMREARDVEPT